MAWDYKNGLGQTATSYGVSNVTNYRTSSCPSGSPIVNGVCNGTVPNLEKSLESVFEENFVNKPWNADFASIAAATIAMGIVRDGSLFTDDMDIVGPNAVPLGETTGTWPVNVLPGTTTPAPAGHTGPTEPATVTQKTTTTAKNTFNPSSSSSSGTATSSGSGPSMTTTTEKLTTTSITNNITNTTNIVNQSTEKSEDPPEEEVKDTPLGPIPDLYKQKYPNGLKGVVTQKIAILKTTPLFSLPMQLMGNLPDTGNCPSWQLDLNLATWANFGTHNIGADCSVWQFASVVVLISAFILARALVFGG